MKTKCNQGCIYWDESSRGYHGNEGRTPYKRGRWVGERMVDGRRVRMRSTDYDKVLHAVMHRHHFSIQRATDVVTEGIEMFLGNAMYRAAPLTNITPNIIKRCNIVVANGKRKLKYQE